MKRNKRLKSNGGGLKKSSSRLRSNNKRITAHDDLNKKLDMIFSKVMRISSSDGDGRVECISCCAVKHWKDMDAGHYIPRFIQSVRWDEMNVWPQCRKCNRELGGNLLSYRTKLIDKIGHDSVKDLEDRRSKSTLSRSEKRELLKFYQEEFKKLVDARR